MKITPQLLAAVAVVAIGGAVSGAAIGDSPVLPRSSQETLPEAQVSFVPGSHKTSAERPPNHYPLETKDGTIPVAELSLHGRYRDTAHARSMMRARDAEQNSVDHAGNYYSDAEVERLAFAEDYGPRPVDPQQSAAARTEQASAEPVTPEPADFVEMRRGNAKSIDVAAALASNGR